MSDSDTTPLTRKPEDTAFKQQRLPAWQPILTPFWVIATFVCIGVVFLPLGIVINNASNDVVEYSIQYDGDGTSSTYSSCQLDSASDTTTCTVSFEIEEDMTAPVYVYYQLDNFYQNHRRYVKSRDDNQLRGEEVSTSDLESNCDPLYKYTDSGTTKYLSPCGLIANSFFNDIYSLSSGSSYTMSEEDIAWETDAEYRYAQPDGFCYVETSDVSDCETTLSSSSSCTGTIDTTTGTVDDYTDSDGTTYCYYYPDTDTYYYLYQRYPNAITPIEGVTNEHFIVWMRTAALPDFRKLYGKIDSDIPAGTTLTFDVDAQFYVNGFEGKKYLVISTTSWFGGANNFLGLTYIIVGSICLVLAIIFLAKQALCPRKLGDTRYLGWKEA